MPVDSGPYMYVTEIWCRFFKWSFFGCVFFFFRCCLVWIRASTVLRREFDFKCSVSLSIVSCFGAGITTFGSHMWRIERHELVKATSLLLFVFLLASCFCSQNTLIYSFRLMGLPFYVDLINKAQFWWIYIWCTHFIESFRKDFQTTNSFWLQFSLNLNFTMCYPDSIIGTLLRSYGTSAEGGNFIHKVRVNSFTSLFIFSGLHFWVKYLTYWKTIFWVFDRQHEIFRSV